MNEPAPSLVGTTLADRYQVVRKMGAGSMGTVYEARHVLLGRRLAIKVLKKAYTSATQRERFFHEARAAGAISHQHVVQVQDFGMAPGGMPYIVMEYVDGMSLQSHMEQVGVVPVEDALRVTCQILSALEVIHASGIIHRDVKPANIMLMRVGRERAFAKLLDFGIARPISPTWQRREITRVDQVLGTPAYLSPEQAASGEPDASWDLWAVATILYEMLTGKLPFRLESMEQVRDDIINCRLNPLRHHRPELPEWLLRVSERCHHPVLSRRFQSATTFLQALEQEVSHPDGDEEGTRTAPFIRLELHSPPPELLRQLTEHAATPEVLAPAPRRAEPAEPAPAEGAAPPAAAAPGKPPVFGNLLGLDPEDVPTHLTRGRLDPEDVPTDVEPGDDAEPEDVPTDRARDDQTERDPARPVRPVRGDDSTTDPRPRPAPGHFDEAPGYGGGASATLRLPPGRGLWRVVLAGALLGLTAAALVIYFLLQRRVW